MNFTIQFHCKLLRISNLDTNTEIILKFPRNHYLYQFSFQLLKLNLNNLYNSISNNIIRNNISLNNFIIMLRFFIKRASLKFATNLLITNTSLPLINNYLVSYLLLL